MTEIEKRRVKLLRDTRKTYSEKYAPPAIHPRYQSTYNSIYGPEEEISNKNSMFFTRIIISIVIFALFFVFDYKKMSIGMVNTQFVTTEIQKSFSQSFPTFIK